MADSRGDRHTSGATKHRDRRMRAAALSSLTVSLLLVVTSHPGGGSPIGAPGYWPWLLTGLQVLALWAAGAKRGWGWLLGAAVQPVWITYAVVTGQIGFIPGCLFSAGVQARSFVRLHPAVPLPGANVRSVQISKESR